MAGLFLVDVTGDGLTPLTAYRFPAQVQDDQSGWKLLMIDSVRRKNGQVKNAAQKKGLIVHPSSTLNGPGIFRVDFAATGALLVTKLKATAVAGQFRTAIRAYAQANNYSAFREDSEWNALVDILAETNDAMVPDPANPVELEQLITSVN